MKIYQIRFLIRFIIILLLASFISIVQAKPIHRILLVVAMDKEAAPLKAALHLTPISIKEHDLPMHAFQGTYQHLIITMIMNGFDTVDHVINTGTEAATLSTEVGIEQFHPDLVISIGTAGGMQADSVGTIYASKKIYFISRRIPRPGYPKNYIDEYSSYLIPHSQLKTGIVCTTDSFYTDPTEELLMTQHHCQAIEMEAAAVAWVSALHHLPMLAIKGVTNQVGVAQAIQQFREELPKVMEQLGEALKKELNLLVKEKR